MQQCSTLEAWINASIYLAKFHMSFCHFQKSNFENLEWENENTVYIWIRRYTYFYLVLQLIHFRYFNFLTLYDSILQMLLDVDVMSLQVYIYSENTVRNLTSPEGMLIWKNYYYNYENIRNFFDLVYITLTRQCGKMLWFLWFNGNLHLKSKRTSITCCQQGMCV